MTRNRIAPLRSCLPCIAIAAAASIAVAQPAPTAATPPMGWNSWNHFAEKVTDADVRATADALVATGMRDAGYVYVNVDDTWEGKRDAHGNIQPNAKFPDMKALGDYIHSRGLKFGIYSSPGPKTCAGFEGSYQHEEQDAKTYASWGVDFLKYDLCGLRDVMGMEKPGYDRVKGAAMMKDAYAKMHQALAHTGRPIVYSLCQYGMDDVWKWGAEVGGNLWRTTDDISDSFRSMALIGFSQDGLAKYAGPGRWNDPDMLEIGNGGMSPDEYRTHMSLWALTAAPLLAGNDIRTMSDTTKSILLNKEVIAIDQDPLGKQASPVKNGELETWVKPLKDGGVAVGVVNLGSAPAAATVKASDLGLKGSPKSARDLWQHADVKFANGAYSAQVPSHGVLLLRVSTH